MKYILFIISFLFCYPCDSRVDVKFTPSKKCENSIVKFIETSEHSIDVAVYSINNDAIVKALKKAHKRGVKIRILTDKLQAAGKSSKVKELYLSGINIRINSQHKIEHNKFAIYDNKIASTGSYNWTNPASDKNSENCLFLIHNKKAIKEYQVRFEYLWKINTKKKSDRWFKNH